jgi:glutathione S-transferase
MILYHFPGACSLAAHIALVEVGLAYNLVSIGRDKRTRDGRDFMAINPKGYVPALELDDRTVLTEGIVILAYIADYAGKLLPKDGLARWRALEATAFMATELHGNFKPFFYSDATQAEKDKARRMLVKRFATLTAQLGDKQFLVSDQMTIADPYLFVMLMWATNHEIELPERLKTWFNRMKEVPSVAQALAEEGLA